MRREQLARLRRLAAPVLVPSSVPFCPARDVSTAMAPVSRGGGLTDDCHLCGRQSEVPSGRLVVAGPAVGVDSMAEHAAAEDRFVGPQ